MKVIHLDETLVECAKIFDAAANKFLSKTNSPNYHSGLNVYSCNAISDAAGGLSAGSFAANWRVRATLISLLEKTGLQQGSTREFKGFKSGIEKQSARYAWLMFLRDICEDGTARDILIGQRARGHDKETYFVA